jgi:hypothetical protein
MNIQYIEIRQFQANFSVFTPLLLALSRRDASGGMHGTVLLHIRDAQLYESIYSGNTVQSTERAP